MTSAPVHESLFGILSHCVHSFCKFAPIPLVYTVFASAHHDEYTSINTYVSCSTVNPWYDIYPTKHVSSVTFRNTFKWRISLGHTLWRRLFLLLQPMIYIVWWRPVVDIWFIVLVFVNGCKEPTASPIAENHTMRRTTDPCVWLVLSPLNRWNKQSAAKVKFMPCAFRQLKRYLNDCLNVKRWFVINQYLVPKLCIRLKNRHWHQINSTHPALGILKVPRTPRFSS